MYQTNNKIKEKEKCQPLFIIADDTVIQQAWWF